MKTKLQREMKLCIYSERYCTGLILGVLYKFIHKSIVAANAIWAVKHLLLYFSQMEGRSGTIENWFTQLIGTNILLVWASIVVLHTDRMEQRELDKLSHRKY